MYSADTERTGSNQKICNNKVNDKGNNEQASIKSTDTDNYSACDTNRIETQNKHLPDILGETQNTGNNSTNINVESKVEIEKKSNSNLKGSKTMIANIKRGTTEVIRKSEHKKHTTYSEKAFSVTMTGEGSCLQILKHVKCDKQEVNNSTEKPEFQVTECENKRKYPIYFGIKSYLHQFYAPLDKNILKNGDYMQEDDFEYLVEPGKRRWRRFWFWMGMCAGLNLLLLGLIILLAGYLTSPRQTVVGYKDNLEVVDRWAIAFNRHLEIWRFAGLCIFCSGVITVMITLFVSSYQQKTTYPYTYIMGATVIPEAFVNNPPPISKRNKCNNGAATVIPIQNIQPNILTCSVYQ